MTTVRAPLATIPTLLRPAVYAVNLTAAQSSNSTTRPIEGPARLSGEALTRRIVGALVDIKV